MKPKIHHGKFKNYEFNKEKSMSEIKSYPPNKPIKVNYDVWCDRTMQKSKIIVNTFHPT